MIGTSEGRLLSVEEGRNYLNWLETAFVIYLALYGKVWDALNMIDSN